MSGAAPAPSAPARRPRLAVIDMARGAAIVAMALYHFCWDLAYFRFIGVDVGYEPGWVAFARTILFAFMFLVGVGLVLAHGRGMRWRPFWRRWAFVVAGALLISLGTWFTFPESFVYFGVLHAIALASLLALPFLFTPLWLSGATSLVIIALPFFFSDPLYDEKAFSWIGFWVTPPPANDLVPVFPWLGVVLLGVVAMRLLERSPWLARLAAITPGRLGRGLAFLGRWSLLIYVVHQPLLLGALYPLASVMGTEAAARAGDFLVSCQSSCEAGGTAPGLCTTYCQCGLEGVERDGLWGPIYSGVVSAAEQAQLDANNRQCSALIYPELNTQ